MGMTDDGDALHLRKGNASFCGVFIPYTWGSEFTLQELRAMLLVRVCRACLREAMLMRSEAARGEVGS